MTGMFEFPNKLMFSNLNNNYMDQTKKFQASLNVYNNESSKSH